MSNPGVIDDPELPLEDDAPPVDEKHEAAVKEASRMGWRPQEEYRGPPGGWRTAEEFLKRGQDILPIVRKDLAKERARADNMENEIKALRLKVDEQKVVMEDLLRMARTASEQGYKRALDELKAQKRAAAQEGDINKVVLLDEQINEVTAERAASTKPENTRQPVSEPTKKEPVQQKNPVVEQFIAENPWFTNDPVLNRAMDTEHVLLLQEAPGLPLEENLERAKQIVMDRFPKKFGIKKVEAKVVEEVEEEVEEEPPVTVKRTRPTSVQAPTREAPNRRTVTGIASIADPQERAAAQMAFARAKRNMPDLQEAEWFAVYENPNIETDDMRSKRKAPNGAAR